MVPVAWAGWPSLLQPNPCPGGREDPEVERDPEANRRSVGRADPAPRKSRLLEGAG